MFATGVENSYPTIILPDGTTKRVDEMEKAGHYKHWKQDFDLVLEMGINFLDTGPHTSAFIPVQGSTTGRLWMKRLIT